MRVPIGSEETSMIEEPATGVLLMAYGAVESLEDVAAYYTDIRNGRTPPPERIGELEERYRAIGGSSPLRAITVSQARALEAKLNEGPGSFQVFVGMKHWHPYIGETVRDEIAGSEVEPLVGVALAPHYSRMSVGGYFSRLEKALGTLDGPPTLLKVEEYHAHPGFIGAVAEGVLEKLDEFARDRGDDRDAARQRVKVVFSAHSLPERVLASGDPYKDQLLASSELVAAACGGLEWQFAFQSASSTGVPWLGPDILEVLDELAADGYRQILVVPIGFVCDHLEVLYDIDVECWELARQRGLDLRRTEMPNDRPSFIDALATIVRERLAAAE